MAAPPEDPRPSSRRTDGADDTYTFAQQEELLDAIGENLFDNDDHDHSDDTHTVSSTAASVESTGEGPIAGAQSGVRNDPHHSVHENSDTIRRPGRSLVVDTKISGHEPQVEYQSLQGHQGHILRAQEEETYNPEPKANDVDHFRLELETLASDHTEPQAYPIDRLKGYESDQEFSSLTSLMNVIKRTMTGTLQPAMSESCSPEADINSDILSQLGTWTAYSKERADFSPLSRDTPHSASRSAGTGRELSMQSHGSFNTMNSGSIRRAFGASGNRQASTATQQSVFGAPTLQDLLQMNPDVPVNNSASVDLTLKILLYPAVHILGPYPSDSATLHLAQHHVSQAIEYAVRGNVGGVMRARIAFYMGLCLLLQAKGDLTKYRAMQWFEAATRAKGVYAEGCRAEEFLRGLKGASFAVHV